MNELDKITEERDNKRKEYEALRTRRLNEFMEGFSIITMKLKEMYQVKLINNCHNKVFPYSCFDKTNLPLKKEGLNYLVA